jgi:hypothetical protein
MTNTPKRPRDLNQWARRMVDIATGEIDDRNQIVAPDPNKDQAAVSLGRKGGLKGGIARAESLSPSERRKPQESAGARNDILTYFLCK